MAQGLRPVILTLDDCGKWDIDAPIYHISRIKTNRIFRKISILKNFLENKYYEKVLIKIREIIEKHKINIVFSFANPMESNYLGAMIKEKMGVKYISHFSDPYYGSFYRKTSIKQKKEAFHYEKYILDNSDRAIFVSQKLKEFVLSKYSNNINQKGAVIPHCFDKNLYPNHIKRKKDEFKFAYIGAFYLKRNPGPLFKALELVLKRNKHLEKKIKLELIGGVNPYAAYKSKYLDRMIMKYNLSRITNVYPKVDYKSSLHSMMEADCLIVIDANVANSPFLPSKLVDYMGAGKPILGITPDNSTTSDILKEMGFPAFNYNEITEIANFIEDLSTGEFSYKINDQFVNRFEVPATTKKLIYQFSNVLAGTTST